MAYEWHRYSRFWEPQKRLSALELVNTGTLDRKLTSLLWLMMEHRASVIVAAGPSFAGKTTILNMLLDFLHPRVKQTHLRGEFEDFGFLKDASPTETYLVASEFSNYFGYVWGDVARKAFQLLAQGYSLGGTIHARTAREVVYILYQYLGLQLPIIAHLGAIINLRVIPGRTYASEPIRRIESVGLPLFAGDTMTIEIIASREPESEAFEFADNKRLREVFSAKFGIGDIDFSREIEIREQELGNLLREGKLSYTEVRQMVVNFYESRPS